MEILEDTRKPKSLALKFALPVVITLPFALPQFTSDFRFAGLALVALFLGVLGSSTGLSRIRENGITERLMLLPQGFGKLLRDFLFANVAMDYLQMLAPLAILVVAFKLSPDSIVLAAFALAMCILMANVIGMLVAIASGGSGEVHLYSAISVLLIAGASGIFSGASSGLMGGISMLLPFDSLTNGLSQAPAGESLSPLLISSAFTIALTIAALLGADRLMRR